MEQTKIETFNIVGDKAAKLDKHKQDVRAEGAKSLIEFGRMFLPDFKRAESAPFHHVIGRDYLDPNIPRLCNVVPRGHAKTTIARAAILYKLYYNPIDRREFIAIVSETQEQSLDTIQYIADQIEDNERLNYYFGDLKGRRPKKWTEKEFVTSLGDRLIGRGTTQRLRGRSQKGLRYTLFLMDDFESEFNTKTINRRDDVKKWFAGTVVPAMDECTEGGGKIWLQGTIVHYDSVLQTVVDNNAIAIEAGETAMWKINFYRAELGGTKTLWEAVFPYEKLMEQKAIFKSLGQPWLYAQEYLNEARDPDSLKFKVDRLRDEKYELVTRNGFNYIVKGDKAIPVNTNIGVDLAYESGKKHDFQIIFPLSMDCDRNLYIGDYYREHSELYDMPRRIVEMGKLINPRITNVEKVGAQGVIKDAVRAMNHADRKAVRGATVGVRPPTGMSKEDKLEGGLCRYVNTGKVFYDSKKHSDLFDEMFHFPKSKYDDLLDGMWLALQKLNPPKSEPFDKAELESMKTHKKKKRRINWKTSLPFSDDM